MAKKKQSSRKDAYTIVLEDIRDNFRAFGESLSFIRDEVKEHTKILAEHSKILAEHSKILAEHSRILAVLKEDIEVLKGEVALIRHNQVTRDEFKFLETRISRLERKLK